MTLLLNAITIGLILALPTMGVYISLRFFNFPDITTEGSFTLGAAVCALMLTHNAPSWLTLPAAFAAGAAAGTATALITTKVNINGLLAGIIVMTGLFSVNLRLLGQNTVNLANHNPPFAVLPAEWLKPYLSPNPIRIMKWEVAPTEIATLAVTAVLILILLILCYYFFRTALGIAIRAAGSNPRMATLIGINPKLMLVLGLACSNGLIATGGMMLAQYQGYADIQMGIGMLIWGMAAVIIGETLIKSSHPAMMIVGMVFGALIFRLLIELAMSWGIEYQNVKLLTAVFVLAALMLPRLVSHLSGRNPSSGEPSC